MHFSMFNDHWKENNCHHHIIYYYHYYLVYPYSIGNLIVYLTLSDLILKGRVRFDSICLA